MTPSAPAMHLVVMGVTATGKTSVGERMAEELGIEFVEGDSFHPPANIEKMSQGVPLDDDDRRPWLEALADVIARSEAAGETVLVTCSALKRGYRDTLRQGVGERRVLFVHLHADFEVLLARMGQRTKHFMPASLLQSQFDTLEPLGDDELGIRIDVEPPLEDVVSSALTALRAEPGG